MTDKLREAVKALGALPDGYCFCSADRTGDDSKEHEPECAAIRAALAAAPQPAPETEPRRCAECTCEGGEHECNWIKPGPIRVVEGGDDAA